MTSSSHPPHPRLNADPLSSNLPPLPFTILGGFGFPGGSVVVSRDALWS